MSEKQPKIGMSVVFRGDDDSLAPALVQRLFPSLPMQTVGLAVFPYGETVDYRSAKYSKDPYDNTWCWPEDIPDEEKTDD